MKKDVLFYLVIGIYFIYCLFVQVKLLNSKKISGQKKIFQSIFIWFIPFLGAWAINWFLSYKELSRDELKKKKWVLNESGIAENL